MPSLRQVATPLTIGAFILSAVTGVLMFFHLDIGLNKTAHEWLSWALVVGVALHLSVNFRAFRGYLKRPVARGLIVGFVILLAASFLPLGGGGSPVAAVMQGLGRAPVAQVVALAGAESGRVTERLRAAGYRAEAEQTIADLAGGDRKAQAEILGLIFQK